MHLFCIKLMTLLTLIKLSQSSILPSSITDKNPSHHQHHGSPSAFHDLSSSSLISNPSSSSSSSTPPPPALEPSISSSSSSSSSSPSFSSSSLSSSSNFETFDILSESASNQNDNSNGDDDRFDSFVSQESHNIQSVPSTNFDNNQHQRSSILLPKIYPSPVITDPFSSSNTFPSHSNSPDEGKSLDYATTLIKEALEGPMMHDSNGDSSDYVEPSSSSLPASPSEFDATMEGQIFGEKERKENGPSGIDGGSSTEEERKGKNGGDESEPGASSDGDEVNSVQPSEDQLFYEVQKLIQYIRESAAAQDKGSSPKSRNNRNRLTLQMDYLQNLLDEYRQKQGTLNLRHWVRGVSPPRLSVTSPIAVLRDALMEEIKRKKIQETQAKIAMNEKILKEVG